MVPIVLLSLLGMGLLAALIVPLFDNSDDGSDDPAVDPVDHPPGPIFVSDGDTVFAGSGNEDITTTAPVEGATVFAGDGDDTIDAEVQSGQLNGGAGEDVITADHYSYSLSVFGGAGNDLIDSSGSAIRARIFGSAGDDLLNLDYSNPPTEEAAEVYGGYGDDTFDVELTLDVVSFPQAVAELSGGVGKDIFNLDVQQGDVVLEFPDTDDTSRGLINIADFQPGIDQLVLDVDGAAVTLSEAADGTFTNIILTYPATGDAPSVQGVIHLAGVTGLTMADLVVQGAAAA